MTHTPRYWCSFCHREVAHFCADDDASIAACQAAQGLPPLPTPWSPDPGLGFCRTLALGMLVLGAMALLCGLLWLVTLWRRLSP